MRPTPDQPRRAPRPRRRRWSLPSGKARVVIIVVVLALLVLVISLRGVAKFYTDYLWFKSLHRTGVWGGVLGAKLVLAAIFMAVFFVLLWINLFIADRLAPAFGPGPEEELVLRYREVIGRRTGLVRVIVAIVFAVIAGAGVSSQWNDWILFTHRVNFGQHDATFHTDVGFYVFQLPFLTFLGSWLFAAFVIILIVTLVAHYLNGGIRVQSTGRGPRVTAQVKAHLSVLLGILALIKTYQYWFQRYGLTFSTRGTVDGATYTDVNVQLKALYLLMLISVFALVLFIVNIWRRGWVLPVLAVGLWALVAVLAGALVPAFVQRFRVQPAESSMERPYIEHNIAATRTAMGLNDVQTSSFSGTSALTAKDLQANAGTVRNIRLWDPSIMMRVFQRQQAIRSFYEINNVDVDRYRLDNGDLTQVEIATRDLSTSGVPQKSWEATHLAYTHGYGAVMAPTNASNSSAPVFVTQDIPVTSNSGAPQIDNQPELYIGTGQSGYVMVNTKRKEIGYTDKDNNTQFTSYNGADGIKLGGGLGGFMRKAAFALRFGDINPLISSNIESGTKVLMNRDVLGRLRALAPFLAWDSDPYPVITDDGRVVYLADGYTSTDHYPNAQRADTSGLPPGSGLRHEFNYVRNSVKAEVDAYNGTVTMYVVDPDDPLIKAYEHAFPKLFTPVSKAPKNLVAHFRYPEDLFRVQTAMWGRYHLDNPDDFYNQQNAWDVAQDPNKEEQPTNNITAVTEQPGQTNLTSDRMDPYYLLMKLPGDQQESFILLRPFVPTKGAGKQVLTSFMVAKSDPDDYGHLEQFQLSAGNLPNGPANVAAEMQQDSDVSRYQTLLCQQGGGTSCEFGSLLLIPINQSLLWVRPLYVQSEQTSLPRLDLVVIAYTDAAGETQVQVAATLHDALEQAFCPTGAQQCQIPTTRETNAPALPAPNGETPSQNNPPSSTTSTTTPGGSSSSTTPPGTTPPGGSGGLSGPNAAKVVDLVNQLDAATTKMKEDAASGNFGAFGQDISDIQSIADQLKAITGSTSGGGGGSSPPTTASAPASGAPPPTGSALGEPRVRVAPG
jgi:uncharacterized membrane protein (UPF0182 family)